MVTQLVEGLELTPGQLAELRAINSLYYTQLAKNASASSETSSVLEHLVVRRVRDMLQVDQQFRFDRNLAAYATALAWDVTPK